MVSGKIEFLTSQGIYNTILQINKLDKGKGVSLKELSNVLKVKKQTIYNRITTLKKQGLLCDAPFKEGKGSTSQYSLNYHILLELMNGGVSLNNSFDYMETRILALKKHKKNAKGVTEQQKTLWCELVKEDEAKTLIKNFLLTIQENEQELNTNGFPVNSLQKAIQLFKIIHFFDATNFSKAT